MIAALYVDPRGPYFGRPDVDPWDETRDARLYDGPHPVVAHPPCGSWSKLKHLYKRNDADCAPRAVAQVRKFGGLLEHPAGSGAWNHCGLPRPNELPDGYGFAVEVQQVSWGHVARKKTWLYCVGISLALVLDTMRTGGEPSHWCSGFRTSTGVTPANYKRTGCAVPPGIKVCSAQQRRRTPPAFADWLISLAESVERRSV